MIPRCSEAGTTSVSGTAFTGAVVDPDPLYNALVYIPNVPAGTKLPPFADGPTCGACTPLTTDTAIASAVTGPDGTFTLQNVPAGAGIPLIVQLGRWRRQITIDVAACTDNALPRGTVRLPRNQAEGDIPLTAVSTGDVDALECLLRKIGIDDAEFTNPSGTGRIHVYQSNGARIDAATPQEAILTGATAGRGTWSRYDQVILPCVGSETPKSSAALGNFLDYLNGGGRVFATHFSYVWLFQNGPLASTGAWQPQQAHPMDPLIATIDTSTSKGMAFAQWLRIVGALSNPAPPQIQIRQPRRDLNTVNSASGAERWIYSDPAVAPTPAGTPATVQHYTVDTPVGAAPGAHCGRVIFSDFHVLDSHAKDVPFPTECEMGPLTAQEKILEFMLFDLASCLGPSLPPPPPPPPPPRRLPRPLVVLRTASVRTCRQMGAAWGVSAGSRHSASDHARIQSVWRRARSSTPLPTKVEFAMVRARQVATSCSLAPLRVLRSRVRLTR